MDSTSRCKVKAHTMDINTLSGKIVIVLNNDISPLEFTDWYEEWFYTQVKREEHESIFTLLEDFYSDLPYYVAKPEVRAEHPSYFGDEVLIEKIMDLKQKINEWLQAR